MSAVKANPLRVAFLTPEFPTDGAPDGGLAHYVRKSAHALAARGHAVTVITLGPVSRRYREDGTEVVVARRRAPLPEVLDYRRAFLREHASARFDVVQSSSYAAPGALLIRNRRLPL